MNFRSIKTLVFLGLFALVLFGVKHVPFVSETKLSKALSMYGCMVLIFYLFFGNRKFTIPVRWNTKVFGLKFIVPVLLLSILFAGYSLYAAQNDWSLQAPIYYILLTAFVQCLGEELIFRGLILNEFTQKWSLRKSAIASSLVFGTMHLVSLLKTSDVEAVVNQVVVAFGLGLFLAAVYLVSRNILVPTILHFFLNLPAYFKRISVENPGVEEIISATSWMETLISSFMVFFMYSPFFIIAFFLLKKVKLDSDTPNEPL